MGGVPVASVDLRIDAYGPCPGFPFDDEGSWRAVGELEAPVVHARTMGSRKAREFTLSWDEAPFGQMWHLRRAFTDAGIHAAMNFLPPDGGGTAEVRYMGDLTIEQTSATAWKATATLEELIR